MEIQKSAQQLGIESYNKQAAEVAEGKALAIIQKILGVNAAIAQSEKNVVIFRKELNDLQNPTISEASVLGATLPVEANRNANQKTIASVIAKFAEGRLGSVQTSALRLTDAITAEQTKIDTNNKALAELRKELAEVKVEIVSVAEVAGK